jgi:hypothetical protein
LNPTSSGGTLKDLGLYTINNFFSPDCSENPTLSRSFDRFRGIAAESRRKHLNDTKLSLLFYFNILQPIIPIKFLTPLPYCLLFLIFKENQPPDAQTF